MLGQFFFFFLRIVTQSLYSYQWKSFSLCTCRSTNDIPIVLMIGCNCAKSCVLANFYTLVFISCMQGFTIIFLINKRSYCYPKKRRSIRNLDNNQSFWNLVCCNSDSYNYAIIRRLLSISLVFHIMNLFQRRQELAEINPYSRLTTASFLSTSIHLHLLYPEAIQHLSCMGSTIIIFSI